MSEKTQNVVTSIFWLFVVVFVFFGSITWPMVGSVYESFQPVTYDDCETVVVPYETVYEGDEYAPNGTYTEVTAEGVDGSNHVCHPSKEGNPDQYDGYVAPVDEVITYIENEPEEEPEYYESVYEYEGGAICVDGWRSYSTGSGTCSWHGGIAYYL